MSIISKKDSLQSDASIIEAGIHIPHMVQAVLKPNELISEPKINNNAQVAGIMRSSAKEYPRGSATANDNDSDSSFMKRRKLIAKLGIAQTPGRIKPRILNLRDSLTRLEKSNIRRNSLLIARTKQDDPMELLRLSSRIQISPNDMNAPEPNDAQTSPAVLLRPNVDETSPVVLPRRNTDETSPNVFTRLIDDEASPIMLKRQTAESQLVSSEEFAAVKQSSPPAILTFAESQTQLPTLETDLVNDKSPENIVQPNSQFNLVMDDAELGEDENKSSNKELLAEYENCNTPYMHSSDILHLQEIQIYDIHCPPKALMSRRRKGRYLDLAGVSAADRNEKIVWVVGETIYAKIDPGRDTWKNRKFHKALSKAMQVVQMRRAEKRNPNCPQCNNSSRYLCQRN